MVITLKEYFGNTPIEYFTEIKCYPIWFKRQLI